MGQPGDPNRTKTPADPDLDDLVGFVSPEGLAGRARPPEAPPTAAYPASAFPPRDAAPEPDLFDPPAPVFPPEPHALSETPAWARETPSVAAPSPSPSRVDAAGPDVAGGMGLYAVYALILFAVPTLGASAALAMLAVTGRPPPDDPVAASHWVFQQRTLWAAAVAAVAGVILVIVNLGVFVLFVLALWLIFRGAWGVLRLKAGRPIDHPRRWLI